MAIYPHNRYWKFSDEEYSPLEARLRLLIIDEIKWGGSKKRIRSIIKYGNKFGFNLDKMEELEKWKKQNATIPKLKRFILGVIKKLPFV